MAYRITSNGAAQRIAQRLDAKARALLPATQKIAVFTARMAARRAPVGTGRSAGALKRSLNCRLTGAAEFVLQSPLAYAAIQHYGGQITAGSGTLGAKLLAIPLNDTARRMLDTLGASTSLRSQNLVFMKSRTGRMFLMQPTEKDVTGLGQGGGKLLRKRVRGAKRQHQMFLGQILFLLVPRVRLPANPAPTGYAPSVRDPEWRSFAARALRQHLTRA